MITLHEQYILDVLHSGDTEDSWVRPIRSDIDDQRSLVCDPIVQQLYAQMLGWA